jgi:hypothetical protein
VFDGQPFFVRIDGRVWVAPEDIPEDAQCTAQTKRRKRCGNPLDYGQSNGFSWLKVPGGYVDGFNYDSDDGRLNERGRRYLEQRCELHFDTDAPSAVEPEWLPFVAAEHQPRIHTTEKVMHSMCGAGMPIDEAPEAAASAAAATEPAASAAGAVDTVDVVDTVRVFDRLLGAGMALEAIERHLGAGRVELDGRTVTDPHQPAPAGTRMTLDVA